MLTEKYRPKNLDDVKGQPHIIPQIKNIIHRYQIDQGEKPPSLLLIGTAGTGKTSTALAIARELYGNFWRQNYVELNASDERGIDVVRDTIKKLSRIKGSRIIFLDEVDNMTSDAQNALRRIMETTVGTIFILSGNRKWKIIEPIQSRCSVFTFKRLSDDVVLRRLLEICKAEGVAVDKEAKEGFLTLIKYSRGDMRKAIMELEKIIGKDGKITANEVIALQKPKSVTEALKTAVDGDFEKAKEILEDAYISSRFDIDDVIDELSEAIQDVKKPELRVRLYIRLAEAERSCRIGSSPLIQLVGFLGFAYVAPHLPEGCPNLTKEG